MKTKKIQQILAKQLPDLIAIKEEPFDDVTHVTFHWLKLFCREINWQTDGLYICHLIELKLSHTQQCLMDNYLGEIQERDSIKKLGYIDLIQCVKRMATFEQRREAILKVLELWEQSI